MNRQQLIHRLRQLWPYLFILIVLVLAVLFLETPQVPCEVNGFHISIKTGSKPMEGIELPVQDAIKVNGGEPIVIKADIQAGPGNCSGSPHVSWSLRSDNALAQAKISGPPTEESIELILTNTSETETIVSIEINNAAGELQERVFLPFNITGDS